MSAITTRIYAELRGDRTIWAILVLLSVFGMLAVYSATGAAAYRLYGGNTEHYMFKQLVFIGLGWFVAYMAHLLHYQRYSRWAPLLLLIVVPLLIYTMFFGVELNDARRWVDIPFTGMTFQPSELAKLALIIYVARSISSKQEYIKDLKEAFVPIIVPVVIICGLIAPSDLSTAVVLFTTCMLMMVIGRVDLKYVFLLIFVGLILFAFLVTMEQFFPVFFRIEPWAVRIGYLLNWRESYQVEQGKRAMANGGWFGLGPGNSIQRNYLPLAFADSIYAIIVEEYGLVGGLVIISLYMLLLFRVVRLVTKSPKAFGAMVALGLAIILVLQAYLNIAVSLGVVPVTGLVMPLISMGGTSVVFTCFSFGIILSVSKYIETVAE